MKTLAACILLYASLLFGHVAKGQGASIESLKAAAAEAPDDVMANYNLGTAYLNAKPSQEGDALWFYARAAMSIKTTPQQSGVLREFVRKLVIHYQGGSTVCQSATDLQVQELLSLAETNADRPPNYRVLSSAELEALRKQITIAAVVQALAGNDQEKAKTAWVVACGLQFRNVPAKVIAVIPGNDTTIFKLAFATSDAEFGAATSPNMEAMIVCQPRAAKIESGAALRFTGTLADNQDINPKLMLRWVSAKVNEENLPKPTNEPANEQLKDARPCSPAAEMH